MEKFARSIVRTRNLLFMLLLLFALVCVHLAGRVAINTDITELLPEDSRVRDGILTMAEEFSGNNTANLQVMFEGLEDDDERREVRRQLRGIENVESVIFDRRSDAHVRDEFTLYTLILEPGMSRDDERALVRAIQDEFYEHEIEMSGQIAGIYIELNMVLITVPMVIILTIILFFMCRSWIEPLVFFINIGIAVFINMGTNLIFGSISDITQMIAGLLQVVLSMDYSIIFLNRYRQEKEARPGGNRKVAMKNAVKNSFNTIAGISFTTIVGMLMLGFMSFGIGADIGFVIGKGVFVSLICVFGLMPSLILRFDKLIERTEKPVLSLKMGLIGGFAYKARYVVGLIFVILFAGAFMLQNQMVITYAEVDYDPVHQVFDLDNTFVVLYENSDEASMIDFVSSFEDEDDVINVIAYGNTIGMRLTEEEFVGMMVQQMDMDLETTPLLVSMVFRNYHEVEPPEMVMAEFIRFLQQDLAMNPMFAGLIPPEMQQLLIGAQHYFGPGMYAHGPDVYYATPFSAEDLSYALSIDDDEMVTQIMHLHDFFVQAQLAAQAAAQAEVEAAMQAQNNPYDYPYEEELDENGEEENEQEEAELTMTLRNFMNYLVDDMSEMDLFAPFFTDESLEEIEEAALELTEVSELFVSENYSRIIVNTTVDFETDETFEFMDRMIAQLEHYLGADFSEGDFLIVGVSALPHEMRQTFPSEYQFITILTTVAFFVVAAISFRSLAVSAILAIVIQASVFITMGVTQFQDGGIMFIPLIIAQVLLKSRVIDYGILYTANYIEARRDLDVKEAIVSALNRSIHTILTSGLIIVLVTFVVGLLFVDVNVAIADILLLIAQGCFVGVLVSIFILPSLVAIFDRFVIKAKASGGH